MAVILLLVSAIAFGSQPDATVQSALRARKGGDYGTAIRLFRGALTQSPRRTDIQLLLAETLAWDKQFQESESLYREVLEREPASRAAKLGFGRVLLWTGRYAAARHVFDELLRTDSGDTDALESRALAAYWSGDFRSAARDFRQVLRIDTTRDLSRRSLQEISAASAPQEHISGSYIDDDQPYRIFRADVAATIASDPLTRWTATVGSYDASAPIYGRSQMPFVQFANETTLPGLKLAITPSIGLLRYPDGVVRPTGGLGVSFRITPNSTIVAGFDHRELLATATGLKTHPSVTTLHAGWRRDAKNGWQAAVDASALRYFDGNRGKAGWAYALVPLASRGRTRFFAGVSATLRDSRDSRFAFAAVSSTRSNSGLFDYAYRGTYAPYWAPQKLREARAIVVAETAFRTATFKLHLDAGIAKDRAVAFGPSSGATPLPPFVYSFDFERRFHPMRADLTASFPMSRGLSCEIGVASERTVFYRAKSIHASLVRHR